MSAPRPPARDLETFALKKKVLRLETLYDASRSLGTAGDDRALLEEILARAVPILDARAGFAAAFEDAEGAGEVVSMGLGPAPTPLDVAKDPFVLDLARAKAPLARGAETVLARPAGSVAGAPLVSGERIVGVLVVLDREARGGDAASFDEEDRRFLGSLAALAAPALEGSRRFRALAADLDRLREENRSLKGTKGVDELLVGDSPAMRRAKELVLRAASSRVNVLVTGESGTGKELAARLLHTGSPRRDGPFLALNCAAMPESLLESELFGIEKGIATGVDARPGKFELASGGTIFLDEIGDTPLSIQAKLLRVLQEREIERVGGRSRIPVDVRVLSATHQSLPDLIREGRFREDLFYRLRVVEIAMPALRERREDVPRLAGHFLARIAAREGRKRPQTLTRDAVKALLDYEFPGNVRELENLLEGAAALVSKDAIEAADLQFGIAGAGGAGGAGAGGALAGERSGAGVSLRHVENAHIRRVLAEVKGNKSRAAKLLGVSRRTLYRKRI